MRQLHSSGASVQAAIRQPGSPATLPGPPLGQRAAGAAEIVGAATSEFETPEYPSVRIARCTTYRAVFSPTPTSTALKMLSAPVSLAPRALGALAAARGLFTSAAAGAYGARPLRRLQATPFRC